jgi:ribosome-binding factor A
MFARRLSVLLRLCSVESVLRGQLSDASRRRAVPQFRQCGTKHSGDKHGDREKEVLDAVEEPCRIVYYGADGTETLQLDPTTALDDNFDWEALERAAGLLDGGDHDDPAFAAIDNLPDDFEDLEFEMDFRTGAIKTKLDAEVLERTAGPKRARPGRRTTKAGTASKSRLSDRRSSSNEMSVLRKGEEAMAESVARSSREILPPLPLHPKTEEKPGMQRRVAMLEAEMERVATEVTYRSTDWTEAGLEIDTVALSKNMRDLTVYYSSARQNEPGAGRGLRRILPEKELRQRVKAAEQSVRRTIAADMDLKYAPTVHFEGLGDQSKTGSGQRADLDLLFDRIAQERKE